ncbi:hypothetical protein [uncultured Sulfitobacter sp.]|uniref:hypothetical protein n=1 Tax=uncultured Sulfitobacter sp. TaxID=191468 RepID=UPI002595709F|nr:hypothetical protein [uncultured Sulfitobacter sp.]
MNTHDMDFRIPPDKNVPAYMLRWWWIPRNSFFNVYLHRVHRSDDDRALHDHPWINFSIVLDGGYYEEMIREGGIHTKTWFAPGSVRFRGSGKIAHRLELPEGINAKHDWHGIPQEFPMELPATTIFITGPVMRRWGFHHPSRWVDAYEWDQFCEDNNVAGMRMDGGSDGQLSERNKLA